MLAAPQAQEEARRVTWNRMMFVLGLEIERRGRTWTTWTLAP